MSADLTWKFALDDIDRNVEKLLRLVEDARPLATCRQSRQLVRDADRAVGEISDALRHLQIANRPPAGVRRPVRAFDFEHSSGAS